MAALKVVDNNIFDRDISSFDLSYPYEYCICRKVKCVVLLPSQKLGLDIQNIWDKLDVSKIFVNYGLAFKSQLRNIKSDSDGNLLLQKLKEKRINFLFRRMKKSLREIQKLSL